MLPEPPAATALRARRLAAMKRLATGLFLAVAAVYLATFAGRDAGVVGFVRAGAEAGMVGALADWFAVTALFRRPLGLPIPHTALVPTRKDDLAADLGAFVTEHFLNADVVRTRLRESDLVTQVGRWLAVPDNAQRVAREVADAVATALSAAAADEIADAVLDVARRDAARRSYAAMAGRLLDEALDLDAQRPLVDLVVAQTRVFLVTNRDALVPHLRGAVESGGLLAWAWATDARMRRLLDKAAAVAADIEADPHHELRQSLEELIHGIAADLRGGGTAARRVDETLRMFLSDERTRAWLVDLVGGGLTALRAALGDPDSVAVRRIALAVRRFGVRLVDDPAFRIRFDAAAERAAVHVVDRYAGEFATHVATVVARWDATEASDRIEVAVGRDLQFIRINGTVVGALAGLAIHAATLPLH